MFCACLKQDGRVLNLPFPGMLVSGMSSVFHHLCRRGDSFRLIEPVSLLKAFSQELIQLKQCLIASCRHAWFSYLQPKMFDFMQGLCTHLGVDLQTTDK
jgi:hypothetical protein